MVSLSITLPHHLEAGLGIGSTLVIEKGCALCLRFLQSASARRQPNHSHAAAVNVDGPHGLEIIGRDSHTRCIAGATK